MRFTIDPNITGTGLARASRVRVRFPAVLPVCTPPRPSPRDSVFDVIPELQSRQIGVARLIRLRNGAATYRTARRWWRRPVFSMDARRIGGRLTAVAVIALPVTETTGQPADIGPRPLP